MRFMRPKATLAFAFSPSHAPLVRRPYTDIINPSRPSRPARSRVRRAAALCTATSPTSPPTTADAHPSTNASVAPPLTFQDALHRLKRYWADAGCIVWHPYNVEVGAGTMNPATFLRVLGPEPWKVAYDEPSIRPDDSRYGDNPNRLQRHTQFQVIVKPAPECAQELVVGSYRALGIDTCKHDVRFVEDNWESPALGAWGLGWEVWLDGMEVTQFTYFQQAGGMPLDSVAVEITYGLERIIMSLQGKSHFKDIVFSPGVTYGEIFLQNELEMSKYNLDEADVQRNNQMFELYEAEALSLLQKRLPVPAYNYLLKASHTFNVLDARGAVGVTERARYFQRMRLLARDVAKLWVERREEAGFPLLQQTPSTTKGPETRTEKPGGVLEPVADLVFEIGLEELPAGDVSNAIVQVERLLSEILSNARLNYSKLEVHGTPRRVAAVVSDLKTRQDDVSNRVRGPPLRVALKDGEPTKAATGFMRSQGITEMSNVEYNESEGYMFATVDSIGRSTVEVLGEAIPELLLRKMNFGKSMRWNDSGVSFSRPVRWILCLLDDQLVPFQFANVRTTKTTRSLRRDDGFASDIPVPSAGEYQSVLSKLQIVLSRDDRAAVVRTNSSRLAKEIGGDVPPAFMEQGLLDEVTDLVENPIPLLGRFDESFLRLPEDVLITVMKKHQRYFPVVEESTGNLLNGFITVANGDASLVDTAAIRKGNEDVLRARYSDAAFFYDKDTRGKKLEDFVLELDGLTFQESLGSMLDKVKRVEQSTRSMCELMNVSAEESDVAVQAAKLYKADLATSMVVEMTSLAGTMGRHYVEVSGEAPRAVSQAIFEANSPRFSGDQLAQSRAGAAVCIADRIDSLVSLFSVGLMPKATADPFALRRAALGAVQTLMQSDSRVDIGDAVRHAADALTRQTGKRVDQSTLDNVVDFVTRRLESYLLDTVHVRDDVVKAVLGVAANATTPVAAKQACDTLTGMLANEAGRQVLADAQATHERAARLLKSIKGTTLTELLARPVDMALFDCDEEHALWEALGGGGQGDKDGRGVDRLGRCVQRLAGMKGVVDGFFDHVFVNAEKEEVRMNRLALCARVVGISRAEVDLTRLVA